MRYELPVEAMSTHLSPEVCRQTGNLYGMVNTVPGRRSGSWLKALDLCLSYLPLEVVSILSLRAFKLCDHLAESFRMTELCLV